MLSCPSSLSPSQVVSNSQPMRSASRQLSSLYESKVPYQAAQKVKFLHLEAEIESLLQQLQTLKQQRIAHSSCDTVGIEISVN